MSISYIIASYGGRDHLSNRHYSEYVLQLHFIHLIKAVSVQRDLVKEVILVIPPVLEPFEKYYDIPGWKEKLTAIGVDLVCVDYIGTNKFHSYDQWIQGCNVARGDYFILIEDDYSLDPDSPNSLKDLVQCYNEMFPDSKGYLCGLVLEPPRHAAISNGIISRKTCEHIPDMLNEFYRQHISGQYEAYSQITFSILFTNFQLPIEDYRHRFKSLFWNSFNNNFEDFSVVDTKHIFVPVQHFVVT